MYIKELKLNSFKSFADKVNIDLNSNFTGIVGPNGSGKSNVVDAIKWVLGEQSVKTLRASSGMTDVIFSGSKSRNESNQAAVSITFDNSDKTLPSEYNEITIKRVVSRSGENEYYLNNEKCRLKDINNLLVDSFSSKESFNIIPQNKIEEILSDKPEERRTIFEEAAGVLKYKNRKEETLKKLDKTHENIDRVDMIIDELKVQIDPLEKASRKALLYKETKSKLENVDIALIVKDITYYSETLKLRESEKDTLELELATSSKENTKVNTEIEKLKANNTKLEDEINDLRNKLDSKKTLLSELLSKKELSIERSKYDKDSTEVKNKLVESKENIHKLTNEISDIETEIKSLNQFKKSKTDELNSFNEQLKTETNNISLVSNEFNNLKKKEFEINSKIDVLNSNIENMSKLPYSVKAVLSNPSLSGIHDIIGNIIDTKEEYKIMLDIALGAASNYIIVENEDSAKKAIEYLKINNKGRATFFPLSVIKPKSIDPEVLNIITNEQGYLGIISDLVDYNQKYYNIIKNQLGNIIATNNIDNAIRISKRINYRYRVVTLQGDILNVGGSISGGSSKANNSYISDKNEIEKLKLLLDNNKTEISNNEKILSEHNYNKQILENKILKLNIEITNLNEQINNKTEKLSNLTSDLDKYKAEVKDLSKNADEDKILENIMKEYYDTEKECNMLEQKINYSSSLKRENLDNLLEKENELKKSSSSNSNIITRMNEIDVETAKTNVLLDNLLNTLNEEYSITYEAAINKYSLEIEETEARKLVSELKRTIKSIGNVNLESIEEYERVNKRYTFLNSQKEDLLASEKDLLNIINDMDYVMIDKFKDTFDKISKEFSKVFKDLFGGGEANLKLTNPENILETGIDIIAIPPGKNLKPLSLLSGGEKTLTAISLLFSIMNLKKVPFVILDEVESALDEVNAEKFGEYLSHYRGKTQLLIITHKKKTMEYVDLLYGITMQESGVSKLVSVKLENIE